MIGCSRSGFCLEHFTLRHIDDCVFEKIDSCGADGRRFHGYFENDSNTIRC